VGILQELTRVLLNFIDEIEDEEFRQKIKHDFFAELEPFIPLIPEAYLEALKKTKFSEIRKLLETKCKSKARIISEEKRWGFLEKGFERFKKKL